MRLVALSGLSGDTDLSPGSKVALFSFLLLLPFCPCASWLELFQ